MLYLKTIFSFYFRQLFVYICKYEDTKIIVQTPSGRIGTLHGGRYGLRKILSSRRLHYAAYQRIRS